MKSLVALLVSLVSFAAGAWTNGALWYDTNGHVVNAHGGGVLTHKERFYLYGEEIPTQGRVLLLPIEILNKSLVL